MDPITMVAIMIGSALIDWASRISVALGRGAITPGPEGPFKVGSLALGALILFAVFLGARSAGKKGKELFKIVAVSAGVLAIIALIAIGITLVDLPRAISTAAKVASVRTQPVDVAGRPNPVLAADELIEAQRGQEERVLSGLCTLDKVVSWDQYISCYLQLSLAIGRAKAHAGAGELDEEGSGLFIPVLESLEGYVYGFEALEEHGKRYGFASRTVEPGRTVTTVTSVVTVTADVLNIRSAPGITGTVLSKVTNGDQLAVLETSPGSEWIKIRHNGVVGWVHSDFVSFPETSVEVTPVAVPIPTPEPVPADLPDLNQLRGELVWLATKTRAADEGVLQRWVASPCREALCKDIRASSLRVTSIYWKAKADVARTARSITDQERLKLLDEAAAMLRMIVAAADANEVLDDQRVLIEKYIIEITK